LLHPPSVYDFRKTNALYGPISDVVPSSPVFEMYPMGLTTIANHLENHGFNVLIVNIAYRMLQDAAFDAEAEIARLNPAVFGIDLHWLPHAHGAIELARLVKKYHPTTPVVFGGLSSSYFHRELLEEYPCVDYVLRGDSTEEPMLELMRALMLGGRLDRVPNLTWRAGDGSVVENPLSHVPQHIDDISVPNILYVIRSVFKYASLANVIPFVDWLDYPVTALLTSRGCSQNCALCGGSRTAYRKLCNRTRPAFRSPEALVRDIRAATQFTRAPVFMLNDIRQGGHAYERRILELLSASKVPNELVFELFSPVRDDFLERMAASVSRFSLEITLESQDERLRKLNGKFPCTNDEIVRTVEKALAAGAGRIDLFFMVGLPKQTYADAVGCVDFARSLLERFGGDKRLWFFVAPLAPFLDPGSPAFEHPEKFGYRKRFQTLEEHRQALTAPTWKHILNYETDSMTRDEIVDATYEAMRRLALLKQEYGFIAQADCDATVQKIDAAREAIAEIDALLLMPPGPARDQALDATRQHLLARQPKAPNPREELKWPISGRRFAPLPHLARIWAGSLATRAHLFTRRRIPLYLEAAGRTRAAAL
ncbi:MAG TPA: TIGR04190 family B12-binding domain/radical SAM domain protein, partial [Longimicrobiales bacterium]